MKKMTAFCTSGSSDPALRSAASKATWLDGQLLSAGADPEDVMERANGLGIN